MTVIIAFYIVAGLCAIGLLGGFLTWRFRYVIWSGWFRADIITEDGEAITITRRLKKSDSEFTVAVNGRLDTYFIIEREDEDKVIEGKTESLIRGSRRVYRAGRYRIPKAYYNAHQSEPINMQLLRKESKVSATRHREIAKNTVTSQLLNAFTENPMREAMAYLIGVGIIILAIVFLGYFLNSKLDTIIEAAAS